jgi:peroxiredoxin Q/BCP
VQGQGLRDRSTELSGADCVVLGASFDTPEENKAFADAQAFDYRLLSDPDKAVGRAYEVARPDDDPAHGFALRIAYLIDPDGVIRRSYQVSDVSGFAGQVLDDLAGLRAG